MKRYGTVASVFVVAWVLMPYFAAAQSDTLLRWKLKQGETFDVELDQDMLAKIDLGGGIQEMPVHFTINFVWTVGEASDEKFAVTQTIDRVRMSMSNPFSGEVSYDSAADEPEGDIAVQIAESFKPMIGLEIKQTLNALGESIECEIDSERLKGLQQGMPGMNFANENTLKNMLAHYGCTLPQEPIASGKSWENVTEIPADPMGTMKTTSTYTYEGEETQDGRALEKIAVKAVVEPIPSDNAPAEMQISEQDNQGVILFDNESGRLVSSVINQKMKMTVVASGQEIQMEMNGDVKVTLKPKQP